MPQELLSPSQVGFSKPLSGKLKGRMPLACKAGMRGGCGRNATLAEPNTRLPRVASRHMRCAFCDKSSKGSTEHVIPRWAGRVLLDLPPTGVNPGGKRMTHRFTPGPNDPSPGFEWESDQPSLTTAAVCLDCNNGWLGDLESEMSSLAKPIILGEARALDAAEQRCIATWSYKTALMLQLVRRPDLRIIPKHRFRELYRQRRPPHDARIWIGSPCEAPAVHEASTEIRLAAPKMSIPGFFTVFAIGKLLALCAGRLAVGPEPIRPGSSVDTRRMVEVWPASLRPVQWPPPQPLMDLHPKRLVQLL